MTALYNENEAFVADWLEDLIAHDLIAPGRVDRRSITELAASDVAGDGQRHFFGGIGGWSYALRGAGIPDRSSIWTGSCPCQPLSDAGQGRGFRDPRHLWPAWFALIRQCRPPVILGEQVASALGLEWLDLVLSDLEGCGYTVGAADLCAAGVGAPHIRQRLYFVAHADGVTRGLLLRPREPGNANAQAGGRSEDCACWDPQCSHRKYGYPLAPGMRRADGTVVTVADAGRAPPRDGRSARRPPAPERREGPTDAPRRGRARRVADAQGRRRRKGSHASQAEPDRGARSSDRRRDGGMANAGGSRLEVFGEQQARRQRATAERGGAASVVANTAASGRPEPESPPPARSEQSDAARLRHGIPAGATRGFWADADWILCRDPSGGPPVARPVEPGTSPLATGVPGRVGLLSGYGNSIVTEVAIQFVRAFLESLPP